MDVESNAFKRALVERRLQVGLWSTLCSNLVAEILAHAGFDWVLLDTEHSPNELPGLVTQLQAMGRGTAAPVVRAAWNDTVLIKRILDIGAQSVLLPYVQTADEARRAVDAVRYPPKGVRGVSIMLDEAMQRLLDFDHRRYWLVNGWSIRFRVAEIEASAVRPHGIKYAFTLHDHDGSRLLGFDNAHGVPRTETYDHRHRFRRTKEIVAYEFRGADGLICDFFAAVEQACKQEGVPFEFEADEVELEAEENDDGTQVTE